MKTNLLKSVVLAASFFGVLGSASAETLRAHIPFGFSADGTTMPAGDYAIRRVTDTPSVLLFENEQTKVQIIVFVRSSAGASTLPAVRLTFTGAGNERMNLVNVASYGGTYELNIPPTGRALKGVALTLTSAGK